MTGIETEEKHTRLSFIGHVGPDIQLGKLRDPRQRRYSRRTQVIDPEWRNRNPGTMLESIERQYRGDQRPELFRRNFIVQEQQVIPALGHNPWRHGRGPGAMAGGK